VLALFVAFPGHEFLVLRPAAMGLFKDPNVFAPFLVPAALMLLEETLAPRLLRARLATKLVLLSILTMGILFAFSRAAWLNFVLGAFVMLCAPVAAPRRRTERGDRSSSSASRPRQCCSRRWPSRRRSRS
jgi:hypothetical protein